MSSQRGLKSVGGQELALLRYLSEHDGVTVGEAAAGFGEPRQLARSTVLTMMERLRKKGYLGRKLVGGVYRYAPRSAPDTAVGRAVRSFVERALGGSISPFVAYLAERERLSDAELAELEDVLARLRQRRPARD
jgi:predicted transcriptional regulator